MRRGELVDLGYSVYLWQGVGGDPVKEKGSITLDQEN